MTDLPVPTTTRWQPLRLGLVDLFHYDDEQFWFRDGRLLLRGNNGTGKSKVLALTLPFLLDGSLAPRRVEPDADPKKRMEWNLLLGGAHPNSERIGYAWVEFGRVDADGNPLTLTLGCGLKAATGRGIVRHWFFTTSQRVGSDLQVVDGSGVVLSRDRLRDALEGFGRLHDRQEDYRRSVDEQLFGLGERRYAALVDLLIQLRQPQLSKRPDERALSAALSESLAPLDQAVIADVAESFRALEEDREQLAEVEATHRAARHFLEHYRRYASVASRRAARGPREAQSQYEQVGRDLVAVEQQVGDARARLGAVTTATGEVEDQQAQVVAEDRALRASPQMRSAEAIEVAARALTERRAAEQTATDDATAAHDAAGSARADVARLRTDHDTDEERAAEQGGVALQAARPAGLADQHEVALASERDAVRVLDRRRDQVQVVSQLATRAEDATRAATRSQEQVDRVDARLDELHEGVRETDRHTAEAVELFGSSVHAYVGEVALLPLGDPVTVAQEARSWGHSLDGACPVESLVGAALTRLLQEIVVERSGTQQSRETVSEELREREAELDRLRAGRHPVPSPVPTRDPEARRGQAGAPLWRLVDFRADVATDARAGIEAALEGAGILDAWVRPDGTVVGARTGDLVLSAGDEAARAEPSLGSVLTAAVDAEDPGARQVGTEVVMSVLSRIGLTEGSRADSSGAGVWVDVDGRFALGSAQGAWQVERARFIGAGAREASRRARVAVLELEIEQLVKQLEQLDGQITALTARVGAAEAESRRYPRQEQEAVNRAHGRAAAAADALAAERHRLDAVQHERDQAYRVRDEHQAELTRTAEELATPTTPGELQAVRESIGVYAAALQLLRERVTTAQRSWAALRDAQGRFDSIEAQREERSRRADRARRDTAAAQHHVDTLRETVGHEVEELMGRLDALSDRSSELDRRRDDLTQQRETALKDEATAAGRAEELLRQRKAAGDQRDTAVDALRRFVETGLLVVALPALDVPDTGAGWTVTTAVALARSIDSGLADVSTETEVWERVQQRVSRELSDLSDQMSRHGHSAVAVQREEGLGVRVLYHGDELELPALDERLGADLALRRQVLSAKEREILENHLVNEVAGQLSDLLGRAQLQVDDLNRELALRKTSTGMQLRVQWRRRADAPAGLDTARGLLLRSDAAWTESDRGSVGAFLQHEIERVRAADPSASWTEHLERALDYRAWHEFTIERHQQGHWRPATGPASGGERVLTVSIPLFAAASSHYNSAPNPYAPRLVLLDEAFAGVDDDARAKCLGMLATFDLDVVMTSEREWGCYPQVPGLAIAQLSRVDGIDAVHVTRWQWDGRDRSRASDPDRATWTASPPRPPVDAGPSLFDETEDRGD